MGKNKIRRRNAGKITLSVLFIVLGLGLSAFEINRCIEPNINDVSRLKAEGIINALISEIIEEEFSVPGEKEEFFHIIYGKGGSVDMVQADTVYINRKLAGLTINLQQKYDDLKPVKVRIPIGSILGSVWLSQTEGGMDVRVLPVSVVTCDYVTGFESQGINQTKYKLYAEIKSSVRVLQPFSQENFQITTKVLLSEMVILGDVPENYVHVPKEDILDVT